MPAKDKAQTKPEAPVRLSPTQREHELAMAYATKPVRATTSTTEVGTGTTGALAGQVYLKSHVTVREETEDWPRYIGRYETELRAILEVHRRINTEGSEPGQAEQNGGE